MLFRSRVLPRRTRCYVVLTCPMTVCRVFAAFQVVLPGFGWFDRVLLGFTEFYRVLASFERVLPRRTRFYVVLPCPMSFYRVFTGFQVVLPGFRM